jgi:nucleotide-binding universal stress UspA family protein
MTETRVTNNRGPIMVAVDGTEDGDRALRYGVEEARRFGRGLRLVHVPHETVPMAPMLPLFAASTLHEIGAQILKDAAETARGYAGDEMPVDVVLEHGPRVAAILDAAAGVRAIVLGPRPASLSKLVLGSTTTGVAARAECPVFCVPSGWEVPHARPRVLVGVDGSPASARVLDAAFVAADLRRAELVILHAWRPSGQYDAVIGGRAFVRQWVELAERELAELVAGRRENHPDVKTRLELRYQRPAVALSELAHASDLLVLGRRGHGAPFALSLGSTARAMIRSEVCPVEVVPV